MTYFKQVPHSIMPLSCAGHRGLNRSASIESVDGNPQGCYVNWQQNNQPVKGNDHYDKTIRIDTINCQIFNGF